MFLNLALLVVSLEPGLLLGVLAELAVGVGLMGHPAGGGAGRGLGHHLVDLLERETLGLGDEEVGEEQAADTGGTPDEENLGTEIALTGVNHVGSDVTDNEVPEPVGGGGESDTLGTDREREDLADNDPSSGTPGGGETEDVDADEHDEDGGGGGGAGESGADDGDDELADQHERGTPDEDLATTEALNGPEGKRRGDDVDDVGDERDEERILDTRLLEEGCAVVEDEVDTGPLLEHLQEDTDQHTAEVARGSEALEAVGPAGLANRHLVVVVGLDLGKLVLDVGGIAGLATEGGERLAGVVRATLLDVPTRGLREEEETDGEQDGPDELDRDGNAVGGGGVPLVGTLTDTRCEENTLMILSVTEAQVRWYNRGTYDGDSPLVSGDDGTTDGLGGNLGHVHDNNSGDDTDTESSDDTTTDEEIKAGGRDLERDTDREDTTGDDDRKTTSDPVRDGTTCKGSDEGTSRQDRCCQT